jgi:hypothetical protein
MFIRTLIVACLLVALAAAHSDAFDGSLIFSAGSARNFPREDCRCVCSSDKSSSDEKADAIADLLLEAKPMVDAV